MEGPDSHRLEDRALLALTVTSFPIPLVALVEPQGITTGPDGNLWFTESGADRIGRMTPSGGLTEFNLPDVDAASGDPTAGQPPSGPAAITTGPDGALWFVGMDGAVGRITTSGAVTEFPVPELSGLPATSIATGPDGALWFTGVPGEVCRITTSGVVTEFPVPDNPPLSGAAPGTQGTQPSLTGIVAGPDGALWFVGMDGAVGRITTSGAVTEFPVPELSGLPATSIATGPDGALWFTGATGQIGRITTSGVVSEFPVPGNYSTLAGLTAGPDGNVWFTEREDGSGDGEQPAVGEITPSGTTTIHALPVGTTLDPDLGVDTDPESITAGRDGDLWFLEDTAVGRITTGGAIQQIPVTVPGMTVTTLQGLASASDGAEWFTATGDIDSNTETGTAFGRIAASGAVKFDFLPLYSYASDLTPGRRGTLWFVDSVTPAGRNNQVTRIGHIKPDGSVETFGIPVPKGETNLAPGAMALGPDGDLYFTGGYTGPKDQHADGYIGRVTARGSVQILPLPAGLAPGGFAKDQGSYSQQGYETMISGPGGRLWFGATDGNQTGIARISTAGKVGRFIPADVDGSLTSGPDGRVWFLEGADQLGVATRSGIVATENLPISLYNQTDNLGLAAGVDGNLWYTDGISSIGRISGLNSVAGGLSPRGRPRRSPDFVPTYGQGSRTNATVNRQPTFAGVASPGAEVTLWVQEQGQDQPTAIGQSHANRVDGSWTLTSRVRLGDGTYAVTATQTGDTGPPDVLYSLTPDSSGNLSNSLVIQSARGAKTAGGKS